MATANIRIGSGSSISYAIYPPSITIASRNGAGVGGAWSNGGVLTYSNYSNQCPYLHGAVLVGGVSNAQLSIEIISPSPQGAVGFNGKGVIKFCRNTCPVVGSPYLHGA